MHNQVRFALAAFAAFSLTIVACSGRGDAPAPLTEMRIKKACIETQCEAYEADRDYQCAICADKCRRADYDCDVDEACTYSCAPPRDCMEIEKRQCASMGFEAELPTNSDKDVEAACGRFSQHEVECNVEGSTDCKAVAAVALHGRVQTYDCMAQLPCGAEDTSSCDPPPTSLGDATCDALNAKCAGECSTESRELLNHLGTWVRADVMAAAANCASETVCADVHRCMSAWRSALPF